MTRLLFSLALIPAVLFGQDINRTYSYDVNGNRVAGPQYSDLKRTGESRHVETRQTINGRSIPAESVEEKVVRQDANGKVIERIVKRFDDGGNPIGIEKQVIEDQTRPDGSGTIKSTIYAGDINGTMQPKARTVTSTTVNGDTKNSETVVERPNFNGGYALSEKVTTTLTKSGEEQRQNTVVMRDLGLGRLVESERLVSEVKKENGQTVENTTNYALGTSGAMSLKDQRVTTTKKNPDGSEQTVVNIFTATTNAIVNDTGRPKLTEQRVIDRRKGAGDTVTEVEMVRTIDNSDPNRLGRPQKLSETVCTGKCGSDAK